MKETVEDSTDVQIDWPQFLERGVDTGRNYVSRRSVLRSSAMVSGVVLGGATLAGNVTANESGKDDYGNGIGEFLNEKAEFKDMPVWDTGVANMTEQEEVEITVGGLTSVAIPEDLAPPGEDVPEELPMAFEPRAVNVSPNAEVTWKWAPGIHHSVTSLEGPEALFNVHGEPGHTYTHSFEEKGTYLYFCHPHGTPYPITFSEPIGEVENLFGMRGAIVVSGNPVE